MASEMDRSPSGRVRPGEGFSSDLIPLDDVIARHVEEALAHTGGNKSEAARLLDISRSRLRRYVDNLDLETPD